MSAIIQANAQCIMLLFGSDMSRGDSNIRALPWFHLQVDTSLEGTTHPLSNLRLQSNAVECCDSAKLYRGAGPFTIQAIPHAHHAVGIRHRGCV